MNRSHTNLSPERSYGSNPENRLLQALDAEAACLPPEVLERLSSARHRAVTAATHHRQSADSRMNKLPHARPARPAAQAGQGWRQALQELCHARPVAAALASGCVAALATVLLFNPAPIQDNEPPEDLAMTSPTSTLASATVATGTVEPTAEPTFEAASFDTQPAAPEFTSAENLDLIGSVDFLLWLDSQQG